MIKSLSAFEALVYLLVILMDIINNKKYIKLSPFIYIAANNHVYRANDSEGMDEACARHQNEAISQNGSFSYNAESQSKSNWGTLQKSK